MNDSVGSVNGLRSAIFYFKVGAGRPQAESPGRLISIGIKLALSGEME